MKKITKKIINNDGTVKREEVPLEYKLNYGIADYLNKAQLNDNHLPIHHCDPDVYPDFIAMCSEKDKFNLTAKTAVGFYSYDRSFDNRDGLYNAIQYRNKKKLKYYKNYYKNIKFVIAPDYSIFDDIWKYENQHRLLRIRVLMLWFVMEIGAIVIPNAVYVSEDKLPLYFSGLENCTVMCFSTKSHVRRADDRKRVKATVKYVVDHFPLKKIIVYSGCGKDETSLKLFRYAIEKGVDVEIIQNTRRQLNKAQMEKRGC